MINTRHVQDVSLSQAPNGCWWAARATLRLPDRKTDALEPVPGSPGNGRDGLTPQSMSIGILSTIPESGTRFKRGEELPYDLAATRIGDAPRLPTTWTARSCIFASTKQRYLSSLHPPRLEAPNPSRSVTGRLKVANRLRAGRCGRRGAENAGVIVIVHTPTIFIASVRSNTASGAGAGSPQSISYS